ncbi:WhiB family transcriptional regulator [Streptomyces sp. NPDC005065]|uniref:WhiB family transcriptional regulator n=1 Tax=unclassified Streptomyces TaxID=2593676 RepID=UPI0033B00717
MPSTGPRVSKQCVDGADVPFPHADYPPRCSDEPDLFQMEWDEAPHGTTEHKVRQAKSICAGCPIAQKCLKWALVNEDLARTGIWGATTARERRALRERLARRLGPDWVGRLSHHGTYERTARSSWPSQRTRQQSRTRVGAV